MIPFADLTLLHTSIQDKIDAALTQIIQTSNFIGGEIVTQFEKEFTKYIGIEHCIGCANGTDSIEILLQTLEIGKGDEVLVPAISWIATSEAVSSVGATPVFVDVDPNYYTIDVLKIEDAITSKTKAIIPVHLYGQAADMDAILSIATKHALYVIEDCAQAHGAKYKGKKVGTFGICASFSFFPGKNLGAFGDAGCMVTNNDTIAEKARMIANHGQKGKHNHIIEGRNSRLDTLHAAILSVKLPYLDTWNAQRIEAAAKYSKILTNSPIQIPHILPNTTHVFHLYVIQTQQRTALQNALTQQQIQTAIHYPTALPFLPCYSEKNYSEKDFPIAFAMQQKILSLPIFPGISDAQIEEVCKTIVATL